jgi:hypothetical protein
MVRWVNSDPIGLNGGINIFHYCRGNPLNAIDKSGESDGKPDVNQTPAPPPAPAAHERYAIDTYANQSKIPQSQRTGGQNLQAHHPLQDKFMTENIAGYESDAAPTQFLETKGSPNPSQRGEHTKISVDQKLNRPASWQQKTFSQTRAETVQQYIDADLMTDQKQGLKAILGSDAHAFTLNDKVEIDPVTGQKTVIKNAKFHQHLNAGNASKPSLSLGIKLSKTTGMALLGLGVFFAAQNAEAAVAKGDKIGEVIAWGTALPGIGGTAFGFLQSGWELMSMLGETNRAALGAMHSRPWGVQGTAPEIQLAEGWFGLFSGH